MSTRCGFTFDWNQPLSKGFVANVLYLFAFILNFAQERKFGTVLINEKFFSTQIQKSLLIGAEKIGFTECTPNKKRKKWNVEAITTILLTIICQSFYHAKSRV